MPDFSTTIWQTASYSLAFGIYLNLFCLCLGAVLIGSLLRKTAKWYWQIPLAWLCGIYAHGVIAILLATAGLLHPGGMLIIHGLLWMLLGMRLRRFQLFAAELPKLQLSKEGVLRAIPLVLFATLLFLFCLVPPTKVDAIAYHLYYPKALLQSIGLPLLFSPYEVLTSFLTIQSHWTWFLGYGAEYAPALTSWIAYVLSTCFLYFWAKPRVERNAALFGTLIAQTTLMKGVGVSAPEDNTFNWLLITLFLAASFEVHDACKALARKRRNRSEKEKQRFSQWFFLLHVIAAFAVCVKLTAVFFCAPVLLYLYAYAINRRALRAKLFLRCALLAALFLPFFARNAMLYQNPFFPQAVAVFGASEFDPHVLSTVLEVETYNAEVPKTLIGLLWEEPKLYLLQNYKQTHPLYWLLALLGLIYVTHRRYYAPLIGLFGSYCIGFWFLPPYYSRFFAGGIDLLLPFGVAQLYSLLLTCNFIRTTTHLHRLGLGLFLAYQFVAYANVVALTYYGRPFLSALAFNKNKATFIAANTDMLETIRWANTNLPQDTKLLLSTRARYYYYMPTEQYTAAMVLGHDGRMVFLPEEFARFLRERGISHVLIDQRIGEPHPERRALRSFLENPRYAKELYRRDDEILDGNRWMPDEIGTVRIFKLNSLLEGETLPSSSLDEQSQEDSAQTDSAQGTRGLNTKEAHSPSEDLSPKNAEN